MLTFLIAIMYIGGVVISAFLLSLYKSGLSGWSNLIITMFVILTWPVWWCVVMTMSTLMIVGYFVYVLCRACVR